LFFLRKLIGIIQITGEFKMHQKFVVEKHPNGYIAYPLGIQGVVAGQGDTASDALADAKSALRFHIDTF
jgi:predicted RNase H-like HicB family nuclease